ncbi:DNA-processing protein DprA [Ectobacillus ponti]|uniref:DNA-processing protein DprA n=1 Tax=Ectobacillus ponti TaxID=2961894 RepID=A0AA41X9V4_9BACI|nr:DNA-processing protein DprA [Ectobacillus ponti]MCP8969015.1 DNA-processing protein DprA [Ectobacillus ponti]
MKQERLLHVHWALFDNHKAMQRLMQWDPDLQQVYTQSPSGLQTLLMLSPRQAQALFYCLHHIPLSSIISQLQCEQIFYVTIWDADYPALLQQIYDPPFILYGKGSRNLLQHACKLAVVGTRTPSSYGMASLQGILRDLLQYDVLIVSGMANGIDTAAHRLALEQKKPTIAVLGGGFRYIYPQTNYTVLKKWQALLLLLSEYPPHVRPQKWHFPKRNRIISGLSQGVLVAEAKERSGSLITADCALEQNRELFAVPGPPFLPTAAGPNRLIQQGAKLVMNAADIIEELWN